MKRLQGKVTLAEQQRRHVKELMERLKELCPVAVTVEDDDGENEEGDPEEFVRVDSSRVSLTSARSFLSDLGLVVQNLRDELTEKEAREVEVSTAGLFVGIVDGVNKSLKNDGDVQRQAELPSPLPADLLRMKPAVFTAIVRKYYEKLQAAG